MTEEIDKEKAQILLDGLECLWSEHYIGNKEMTDKIIEVATLLRQEYNIEKQEFEEF